MDDRIIKEKQDLTYLDWSKIRNSSGTAGSFLKAYSEWDGKKRYYKLSNYDSFKGIVGHECINEIIVDRLLDLLGINHLHYQLIHADILVNDVLLETWLCASEDFKRKGESKVALDAFYQAERREGETPLDFCIRCGWEHEIYEMLVVDYLILNRDRHGGNMEVLRDSLRHSFRLAPLFDHGISLLFSCRTEEEFEKADVLEDRPVQSFVGSRSARENLQLIPKEKLPELKLLMEGHKEYLLDGLDQALPRRDLEKIWEMIWRRWKACENFCNTQ